MGVIAIGRLVDEGF
jgi:hypothetical protein